ncbi:hypothetical protein LIER_18777 [Lithospermum erythrorhizon]|uniref:Uncharacterized protein n=1 Tax=Lithospermum erythrorhizon TaxID=34254 RepID=A0AAV3QGW7_LITER
MSRKRKSHSPEEEELPNEFFDLEEPEPWWREEGTINNFPKDYGRKNDFFTIKIRPNERFQKLVGHHMYVDGWVKVEGMEVEGDVDNNESVVADDVERVEVEGVEVEGGVVAQTEDVVAQIEDVERLEVQGPQV